MFFHSQKTKLYFWIHSLHFCSIFYCCAIAYNTNKYEKNEDKWEHLGKCVTVWVQWRWSRCAFQQVIHGGHGAVHQSIWQQYKSVQTEIRSSCFQWRKFRAPRGSPLCFCSPCFIENPELLSLPTKFYIWACFLLFFINTENAIVYH